MQRLRRHGPGGCMTRLVALVDASLPAIRLAGALASAGLTLRRDPRLRHLVIGAAHGPRQSMEMQRLLNALAVTAQEAHHKIR